MNLQRTFTIPFGLIAWLEQTQIHLPLKAIECRFEASGAAVDVQIDQIFHQSAGRALDITYSFPLPSKAAAYRCEMIVNGRTIRAKVVEQEAAREIARQKKAEGRRTALVEMERGNLFTLSLGNVQPDDILVIRFAYVEELDGMEGRTGAADSIQSRCALRPRQAPFTREFRQGCSRRYRPSPGRLTDLAAAH
jgi:Ca-activated chloride channel family protein